MPAYQGCRAVATALVIGTVLAGCHGGSPQPTATTTAPTSASPSASPTLDATQSSAAQAILAAFTGYRAAEQAANVSGTGQPAGELQKYLVDPLLAQTVGGLVQNSQKGVFYDGTSTADPRITQLNLGGQPATATLVACEDYTRYHLVYRSNKSPVSVPSGNRRYPTTYTATLVTGQGWRLSSATSNRSTTC